MVEEFYLPSIVPKDRFEQTVEGLLTQIARLEKALDQARGREDRDTIERHLTQREKRLERMIPYPFRRQLTLLCEEAGIHSNFI